MRTKILAVALMSCLASWHAFAAVDETSGVVNSPSVTYLPTFDADGVADGALEVVFPAAAVGSPADASVTPTANGGDVPGAVTVSCSTSAGFTITGGNNQVFNAPGSGNPGTPIGLRCTSSSQAQTGTLSCTETDSPSQSSRTRLWDLGCPSGGGPPEFTSSPPSGGTLTITGPAGTNATDGVDVFNTGQGDLALTGCSLSGTGISLGAVTSPIPALGSGSINVVCALPAVAGTSNNGVLTCNTNDADEAVAIYNIVCAAQAVGTPTQSVPSLGIGALMLLAMLMMVSAFIARR